MDNQRADDNERLRRLAAAELASMRVELTRALKDRVELHQDLNALAERLSRQEEQTIAAKSEADEARAQLDATRGELASARRDIDSRQHDLSVALAQISALRESLAIATRKPPRPWMRFIPRPVKQAAKKVLARGRNK